MKLGRFCIALVMGLVALPVALPVVAADESTTTTATSAAATSTTATLPQDVVRHATAQVLALIDSSQAWAKEDPERFFVEVEQILSPAIDFDGFARSVMAANYKKATDEQRQRFAESFKWSLVRTYALALTGFSDGEVVVLDPDGSATSETRESVKQEIRTSAGDLYTVIYSMGLGKDGQWRVRNLIIQGVNIGLAFRSQFASAVADNRHGGDLDKVIDAWANNMSGKTP